MQNHTDTSPGHDPAPDDAVEADVLIGRIIDLEATDEDQQRFEQLATADPSLWRTLASRQLDMAVLAQRVTEETSSANGVELPVVVHSRRVPWTLAYTGWAAVLVIAAVWAILPRGGSNSSGPDLAPIELTPDEHFRLYNDAEFVGQELDPILLDKEVLPDGRIRIYYMRRIEESAIIDPPLERVVDEDGHLKVPPAKLRGDSAIPVNDQ